MPINFNVDPYYDDFDQTKNFHRILFKPGRAVQARELTQAQTIIQDQITKFADNIFKQNSPVTGGNVTTNFNNYYLKLQSTYNGFPIDVSQFDGLLIKNTDGSVVARVVGVAQETGGDPPTLILSYRTGNQFSDGDIITDTESNLQAQAIVSDATGKSSTASITQGVFYILGNFVQIQDSTIILDKYDDTPSKRIGLSITETIYDYIDDSSLLDPAIGASNYQAPGADRYVISIALDSRALDFGDDQNFIELVRVTNGEVSKLVDGSVYNVIDDYFAKRDYETNGDYVVKDFKLTTRTNEDPDLYTLSVGKGLAYVHGYRVENSAQIELESNRARTTDGQTDRPIYINYGNYLYLDNIRGYNGSSFDTTTAQSIDLHCVDIANVSTTNTSTYNSTVVASALIRGLVYDHSTNDSDANTYVHKAFVYDVSEKTISGTARSGNTLSTIKLPANATISTVDGAYVGVNISLTGGTSAGDFRTITSYTGSTRTATVNTNWTVVPDNTTTFKLNFAVKDTEIVASKTGSSSYTLTAAASINASSRTNGLSTGDTYIENPDSPELIFKVGNPFVASLTGAHYTTQLLFRSVDFTSSGSDITGRTTFTSSSLQHFGNPNDVLDNSTVRELYTIIVTDKKTNTTFNDGDMLTWSSGSGRTVTITGSNSATAEFTASDLDPFTADIYVTAYIANAEDTGSILKTKKLITASNTSVIDDSSGFSAINTNTYVDDTTDTSTGQIFIKHAGLVSPGSSQSLYLSDVKQLIKIIDTKGETVNVSMLTASTYDVTTHYLFDNGQRDAYYDHASITLKPGAPQPTGDLLVLVDYYQHSGGDGYFNLTSYDTEYTTIPTYKSKTGTLYSLRDCIDFRPARRNATSDFIFRVSSVSSGNTYTGYQGISLPVDSELFTTDYEYYLSRRDKLVLTKDKTFKIVEGAPALNPLPPAEPDGSLVLANISHRAYTGYLPTETPVGTVSDLSVEKVKHKRYTMQDIAHIENRIDNIEYYASLSLLEQKATALQITDAYGLNRFKNGIMTDDFSSFNTADTLNSDFSMNINTRERVATAPQVVKNFPLKSTALISNMGTLSTTARAAMSYAVGTDSNVNYFTLPYTTANVASQKFASRSVNVNPFSFSTKDGVLSISPNMDNWVDTNYAPAQLIIDPTMNLYTATPEAHYLYTDYKTIPGTTTVDNYVEGHGVNPSPYGYRGYHETATYEHQLQTDYSGYYGSTYAITNNYITDVSILPYMRPQQIVTRARDMLHNTTINAYFDGTNVDNYMRKANIIELNAVSGSFKENDVVGYYSSGTFYATGRVVGVYKKTNTTTRLYIAADPYSTRYTLNGAVDGSDTLYNAYFPSNGNPAQTSTTANGKVTSISHFAGAISHAKSTTLLKLGGTAPTANGYYGTGANTIYINAGTGAGQKAVITNYYGANQTLALATTISAANGDVYSIGSFKTDETGSFYGIFNLPGNTFHNGERALRLDNSNGNKGAETTYSESTFYAEGLQTTAVKQTMASSPASVKDIWVSGSKVNDILVDYSISPWDPVAQTFMVSKQNYPNGLFLDSITVFFKTKPTTDTAPISLSIVETLNGYPTRTTISNSVVTKYPQDIVVSETPQYLDTNTKTVFKFDVPVYVQPETLYAFILKSRSNEYIMHTAMAGDVALESSTKNTPTGTPNKTKLSSAPYVGGLFTSQNSQTWTVDQNQALMFVIDRCVFSTSSATMAFAIPNKLPERTLIDQSVQYYLNANSVSTTIDTISNDNILVDAFNVTTTDFVPTNTGISYSYSATLQNGTSAGTKNIIPGKFGTPAQQDIYLDDGKGERVLLANSNSSFLLYAQVSTTDSSVSPIISDAGLSAYALQWNINDCELANNLITVTNSGSGYGSSNTVVTFSAPTGKGGTQAYGSANVSNGAITSVYVTTPGSGYIETPTVTITVNDAGSGTGATALVSGETGKNGGNAESRYVSKKVSLEQGFDSGDLNVFISAYRPVNTDIHVYYKTLNRNDTQRFEDGVWQLMTKTKNCDSRYSRTRDDIVEYTFAPGTGGVEQGYVEYTSSNGTTYHEFNQFSIKIVLTTTDKTFTPILRDLRTIALPSNVNTSF